MSKEQLPDGFSFDDFLAALDAVDAPVDEDLPTDADGYVELVTLAIAEVPAAVARLKDASIEAHVEAPDDEEIRGGGATASVFVPPGELGRARRTLGISR